jgi:NADH:ubiquinone oxidoreductase subunit F (NADH-binding)
MNLFDGRLDVRGDGLVEGTPHDLQRHRSQYPLGDRDADLHRLVTTTGLQGYGGAGFSVSRKWDTALRAGGSGVVVANGAESEPASSKDAALLQLRPHLVLDGLSAVARATASRRGVVWLHKGAWHSRAAITRALADRRSAGVADVPIAIVEGPRAYLSGESSAVVNGLSGGPAVPLTLGVPAAASGIGGRPTVVHNVETLARVALVASGVGADGGRLVTITTPESRVVVEAAGSDRLGALASGLSSLPIAHVLLGGYGGSWHRWESVASIPLTDVWPQVGPGIVMTLPRGVCGVSTTARILRYLASASARQCGPCMFGLDELAHVMERVADGRARRADIARLQQVSSAVAGRGACHHPDGAIRMIGSAIELFGQDFAAHRRSQRCSLRHDLPASGSRAA